MLVGTEDMKIKGAAGNWKASLVLSRGKGRDLGMQRGGKVIHRKWEGDI